MAKSKLSQLMSRVRAGKIRPADRKQLRIHAARARRARSRFARKSLLR